MMGPRFFESLGGCVLMIRSLFAFCVLALFFPLNSSAHYLWVVVPKIGESSEPIADIFFEESPAAGDGHYLDHFLGTSKVWVRTLVSPSPEPLVAEEVKLGDNRWMRVAIEGDDQRSVDAYGKFGVYEYGKTKVLLHYYARMLQAQTHDAMHELGRAEQLDCDLVPHQSGSKMELTLLWQNEPVADRMVFVRGPNKFRQNVKTDERGRVTVTPNESGRYTFRSSVEVNTPGTENGEAYELIRHNITLLMMLHGSDTTQ
jgi:hypothetical protein